MAFKKNPLKKAPGFSLQTTSIVSAEEVYKKGPTLLVFYDKQGSNF